MKEKNELIGTLGFYKWNKKHSSVEVGFDLMRLYWGSGFMAEALRALIDYGFKHMKLIRIEATTNIKNIRSINLMESVGFKKEGVLRKKYFYGGHYHDDIIYSVLNDEWMK